MESSEQPTQNIGLKPMGLSAQAYIRSVEAARKLLRVNTVASASPPINIEKIAESLGFRVVRLYAVPEEFSGIVSPRHRLIGINGHHHRHRQRFTLAHEIGHVVLNHPPERACSLARIALLNREADAFASELLIPTDMLRVFLRTVKHPAPLSRLFDVSEEAMARKVRGLSFQG
jgi:Zn-dependent peptidase ImmA (M78 family)